MKRNKGKGGIDGMQVDELLPYLREHQSELIQQLREGKYKPNPVRRVEIPKEEKSTGKIDAAVATVMALDRAIRKQGSEGSVYDGRVILFFKKENFSGRWRGLNDHGFIYVSE